MSNLKPKKDKEGNPTSIAQISRLLRTKVEDEEDKRVEEIIEEEPEITEKEQDKNQTKEQQPLVKGTNLENMILEAKQKNDPAVAKAPIMVDGDLCDVFALLKAKKKVAAARIVSMICRQWVIQNRGELEEMLGQKINVQ